MLPLIIIAVILAGVGAVALYLAQGPYYCPMEDEDAQEAYRLWVSNHDA